MGQVTKPPILPTELMTDTTKNQGFSQGIGRWLGTAEVYDGNGHFVGDATDRRHVQRQGGNLIRMTLQTNRWEAWSSAGNLVGSYSLSGGHALSGHFHYVRQQLRVWRREVVNHDGSLKAIVHNWYRGGTRIGAQYGILHFESYGQ